MNKTRRIPNLFLFHDGEISLPRGAGAPCHQVVLMSGLPAGRARIGAYREIHDVRRYDGANLLLIYIIHQT